MKELRIKRQEEVTGMRVPSEDVSNWMHALQTGEASFSPEEINSFVNLQLVQNILKYHDEGLSQAECYNRLLEEVRASGSEPSPRGLEYLREAVDVSYRISAKNKREI